MKKVLIVAGLIIAGIVTGGGIAYLKYSSNTVTESKNEIIQANTPYKVEMIIDFNKPKDKTASSILYKFLLDENKDNEVMKEELIKYTDEASCAYFIDLNDDDVDEIVGMMFMPAYFGTAGGTVFILSKQDKMYVKIDSFSLQPDYIVYVLFNKTNSYKDFVVFVRLDGEPTILKFDGKYYISSQPNSILNKYIKNFKNSLNNSIKN